MLVVEDNTDVREYVSETFSEEFEVLAAANGRDGLETVLPENTGRHHQRHHDASDGWNRVLQKSKGRPAAESSPFILTAKNTMVNKAKATLPVPTSYITKPFSGRFVLRSRVYNILENGKK